MNCHKGGRTSSVYRKSRAVQIEEVGHLCWYYTSTESSDGVIGQLLSKLCGTSLEFPIHGTCLDTVQSD
jgi:hypothetical protein